MIEEITLDPLDARKLIEQAIVLLEYPSYLNARTTHVRKWRILNSEKEFFTLRHTTWQASPKLEKNILFFDSDQDRHLRLLYSIRDYPTDFKNILDTRRWDSGLTHDAARGFATRYIFRQQEAVNIAKVAAPAAEGKPGGFTECLEGLDAALRRALGQGVSPNYLLRYTANNLKQSLKQQLEEIEHLSL